MDHEGDGDTSCNWCTWNNPQRIDKGTRRHRNQRTSRDHRDYRIIKIGQNTEKSSGDLSRLTVTHKSGEKSSANASVKHFQKSEIRTD